MHRSTHAILTRVIANLMPTHDLPSPTTPRSTDTESDDDTVGGESLGGQPTNLATARLLPERPYMPGEQFSIFNGNGAEPMSHRGDFDDEFVSRHSADLPDGEGGTMRRVTASLLEILTQVAAVSKDGALC